MMKQIPQSTQSAYTRKTREAKQKQSSDNTQSQNIKVKKYSKEEVIISTRGRKNIKIDNNLQGMKYNKSSQYRNTSSGSTGGASRRNKEAFKTANYHSDEISDLNIEENIQEYANKNTKITKITKAKSSYTKNSSNSNNSKGSFSNSLKKYKKNSCNCCNCNNNELSEDDENKLPQEIFQILWEVYDANINGKNISDLVRRYHQSVYEFCAKEEQHEIVYFVKLFSEKVIEALKVGIINSDINIHIFCIESNE
jgi:hypothetical protein